MVLPWSGTGLAEWLRNAVLIAMIVVVVARLRSEMKAALALMAAALAGVTLSGLHPVAVLYLGYAVVALGLITSGAFYFLRNHSFPGWLRPLGSPFAQGLTVVTGLGMVFGGLGAPHSVDAETFDTETLQTLRGSFPWLALLVLIRTAVAWSSISRAALGQRSQQPPEDAFPPITTPAAARAWSLNRQRLKQTIQQIETSPASKLAPAESGYLSERARAALAEVGRREDEARLTQAREELETLGRAIQDEYHLLDLPGEAQTVTRWPTSAPPESPPLAPSRQPCTDLDRREPTDQDT
ncbi:hypothetical protein [Deinococcus arenicola]|uniref:Na+/H+ antiporter n=1 Tax=Deinococcus arenicola TaxID=2994950 RepID=A0ABU4DL44_9DEIO|nr:hypothetical protein [Deinococcus sp. ZS9-10]MDV6373141.1 hypothetical protein [Deinococcus sp. ZS9-10]